MSRQPRDAKKGVRNWNWPLTGCFEWELRKTGFCEGGRVDGRVKYLGLPVQARGL